MAKVVPQRVHRRQQRLELLRRPGAGEEEALGLVAGELLQAFELLDCLLLGDRKWQLHGAIPFIKLGCKLVRFDADVIRV